MTQFAKIRALLWERTLETGPLLLIALTMFGAICAALVMLRPLDAITSNDMLEFAIVISFFVAIFTEVVLLISFGDASGLSFGLPSHAMRLPVGTASLVFWRLAFNFAALNLTLCAVVLTVNEMGRQTGQEPYGLAVPLCAANAIYLFAQTAALVFGRGDLPWRILGGVLLLFALLWYAVNEFLLPDSWTLQIGAFVAAFVFSVWGVTLQRRGVENPIALVSRPGLKELLSRFADSERPFASPSEAQRWFERNRIGRLFPIMAPALTLVMLSGSWAVMIERTELRKLGDLFSRTITGLLETSIAGGTIAVFIVGGLIFNQNIRAQSINSNGFFFTRPLSTRDLASARIASILRSAVTGVLILAPGSALSYCVVTVSKYQGFNLGTFVALPVIGVSFVVLCAVCASYAFSLIWWGNLVAFFGVLAAIWLAIIAGEYTYHQITGDWLGGSLPNDWHVWAWLGIMVLTLAGSVVLAHRRDLLNQRAAVAATAFWILLVLLVMPGLLSLGPLISDPDFRPFFIATAILGIAPFATVPLVMQWARHR